MNTNPLFESHEADLTLMKRGKVRDVYAMGDDRLLIVATDRLSAFDCILPTPIPGKGQILTQLSNYWFGQTQHIIPNHLVDPAPGAHDAARAHLHGRAVLVRKAAPVAIEAIVRGYLVGSGWKDYQRTGSVCGISLPAGLRESEQLPEPLFTPSTKADIGQHDENISFTQAADIVGQALADQIRQVSIALYSFAAAAALTRGLIIADTKFEFGLLDDGELILIDEALTPDSSRFWPLESYAPGKSQPSFDKQYVRDYLLGLAWNQQPPAPTLPTEVVEQTAAKYREALTRLCGDEHAR
jgi:phosphoribosylaminoimidazole-succinocarboxamide synthase